MAEASSGVSGSSQSGSGAAEQSRAANEAAEAQRAAEAAAASAINATPTPALSTLETTPVDLSISMSALSQLNAMQVTTPSLDFSVTTLGGVPTATTYADVALSTPPTPTAAEYSDVSPSFSIDGYNTADPNATDISSLGVNVGVNYTGSFDATMNARFGLDPANVTVNGSIGYSNALSSFNFSASAGPFGGPAEPNYNAAISSSLNFDGLNKLGLDAAASFNAQGFQNGNVTVGLTHDFSNTVSGYAKSTANFNNTGFTGVIGETGLNYKENGTSVGFTGRGTYNAGTGGITGYFGVRADIRF